MTRPRTARFAFTLVELLVVMAIVAVLLAVLIPTVSRARLEAKRLIASTLVRSVTQGFLAYAADNNGWLMPGNTNPGNWSSPNYYYNSASTIRIDFTKIIKDYRLENTARHPMVRWPSYNSNSDPYRVWPYSYLPGYSVSDRFATTKVLGGPLRVDRAIPAQVLTSEFLEYRGNTFYWTLEPMRDGGGQLLLNNGTTECYEVPAAQVWGTFVGMYDGAVVPRRFNQITTWVDRHISGGTAFKLPMLQP